jgi:hypothetical protein
MQIKWEIEDGYIGSSRPQYTDVPNEELAECSDDEERKQLIDDYVREDFEQRIAYSIKWPDPSEYPKAEDFE